MTNLLESAPMLAEVGGPGLLASLFIGGLAGWLAGKITRGRGFGVIRNVIIGIIGSMLGSLVFYIIGIGAHSFLGNLVMATFGAVLLLYLINVIVRGK